MKLLKVASFVASIGVAGSAAFGQAVAPKHTASAKSSSAPSSISQFAPLAEWKAAVSAGDIKALEALYTTNPPSQSRSPLGESSDPTSEPLYWASLAPQGLHDFNPKVLEISHPMQGVTVLTLRMEFSLGHGAGTPLVVAGAQEWVHQNGWKIAQSQRSDPHPAPQRRLPEPAKFNTDLYAPPAAAKGEITDALAKARSQHKRVILMFGGNWCIDCHVLDAAMHTKSVAPLLNANYILVHVNIGDAGDENLDLAAKYETPVNDGVPALAVLDPDGRLVFSQKQGEFKTSTKIGPEDVVNFLEKWKPSKS
ncbi:MAG: thioredoxin family protein [Candidatus Acidiferrales bacterium]